MAERHGAGGDDAVPGRPDPVYDSYVGESGWDAGDYGHHGYADPYRDSHADPYADPYGDPYAGQVDDRAWTGEPAAGWDRSRWEPEEYLEPEPPSGAVVAQHRVAPHNELRADFGAHLETHYPRLVAQLYAITLHPGDAHEAVQDAYSRAWRNWSALRATEDAGDDDVVGWVRRVAIRTSMRGWRPGLTRAGLRRNRLPAAESLDPGTAGLLDALARLPLAVRRAIVLRHMAGLSNAEIADLERIGEPAVRERLRRGRDAVHEGMDEMLGRAAGAAGGTAEPVSGGWAVDPASGGWPAQQADGGGERWATGRHGLRGGRA